MYRLVLAIPPLPALVPAQNTPARYGTVQDAQGAVVPNVKVTGRASRTGS